MFSNPNRRVPAAIPGSSDVYDGIKIVADPRRTSLRYNEAALFGHAAGGILPLYLVAYTRVAPGRQVSNV